MRHRHRTHNKHTHTQKQRLFEVVYPLHYQVLPFSWNWTRKRVEFTGFVLASFAISTFIIFIYISICVCVSVIFLYKFRFVVLSFIFHVNKIGREPTESICNTQRAHLSCFVFSAFRIIFAFAHLFININNQWTMAMPSVTKNISNFYNVCSTYLSSGLFYSILFLYSKVLLLVLCVNSLRFIFVHFHSE